MKRIAFLGIWIAVFGLTNITIAADPEPAQGSVDENQDPSFWMRRKLELSQKVFASLASGDFATIKESAEAMNKLNQFEAIVRGRNPDYRTQMDIFRFANKELIAQAEKENIDGAALAFNQLTLSCVNCHKHLRSNPK